MSKTMHLKAIIKNLAVKSHLPAQAVLQNIMLERLLERISMIHELGPAPANTGRA